MTPSHAALVMVGIAIVTVVGDYFLKLASQEIRPIQNWWFLVGCVIYALGAFGWVFAMRHLKLATIGVVYSVSTVLLLTGLGTAVFGETLNRYEVVGIGLAVVSIILLCRFGG